MNKVWVFGHLQTTHHELVRVEGTDEFFQPVLDELRQLGYLLLYTEEV